MKRLLVTFTAISMLASVPAFAGEKDEVETAFANWRAALSSGKAENVVKLYADDAVLLATLADKPITSQRKRTHYFEGLVTRPKMKATLNSEYVRLLDEDDAVISGIYTFSFEDAGKTVEIPARYTFVYEKTDGAWKIVEHHSSKLPSLSK